VHWTTPIASETEPAKEAKADGDEVLELYYVISKYKPQKEESVTSDDTEHKRVVSKQLAPTTVPASRRSPSSDSSKLEMTKDASGTKDTSGIDGKARADSKQPVNRERATDRKAKTVPGRKATDKETDLPPVSLASLTPEHFEIGMRRLPKSASLQLHALVGTVRSRLASRGGDQPPTADDTTAFSQMIVSLRRHFRGGDSASPSGDTDPPCSLAFAALLERALDTSTEGGLLTSNASLASLMLAVLPS